MDYEKKYNDALNLAKSYYGKGSNEFLDTMFPELRESEDEEIRKHIIDLIKDNAKAKSIPCDAEIAYLEKQRELPFVKDVVLGYPGLYYYDGERMHFQGNPAMEEKQKESLHIPETCKENADSFTDACKDVIVAIEKYLDWLTGYPDYAPKGKYSIRDMLYCLSLLEKQKEPENVSATTMIPSCWEVEQKEQKPTIAGNDFGWIDELKHDLEHPEELDQNVDDVLKQRKGIRALEWSEEEKQKLNRIYSIIGWAMDEHAFSSCKKLLGDKEGVELQDFLRSIAKPKEEWSEEDKGILLSVKCVIDEVWHSKNNTTDYSADELEEMWHWLDTLWQRVEYPQPHWKPSKEQMRVLKQVEDRVAMKDGYWEQVLDSLYLDLQKL